MILLRMSVSGASKMDKVMGILTVHMDALS